MASQQDRFFAAAAAQPSEASPGGAAEGVKPARNWKRLGKRIAIDAAAIYLLLCLGLFFFQKRFVYRPQPEAALNPADYGFAALQGRVVTARTADGITLKGWQISSSRAGQNQDRNLSEAPLVVLFFTGNAGNRSDRAQKFRQLRNLGAEVVCFDYRGYGDSEGSPDEAGLAADARAAWQFLRSRNVAAGKIVLQGESLGGAVAVRLAAELCAENTPPGGLVVESSFARLSDVGALHYWFIPVRLLLTEQFPSIERIPKATCPILMFHGGKDNLIPMQQGRELFAAAPGQSKSGIEKTFVALPECGHGDLGLQNSEEYIAALRKFYESVAPESKTPERQPREHHTRRERRRVGEGDKDKDRGESAPAVPPRAPTAPARKP